MILKKPYAFLIKHFKLIHFILAILLCFIAVKYINVVSFFTGYVSNNYMVSSTYGLASKYIPIVLFISVLLSVTLAVTITLLLNHKNKPMALYILIVVYYSILFFIFLYLASVLSSFREALLAASTARAIRDIVVILALPQFIFILFCLARSVGFNIKKFDFASDAKELNLSSSDSEEFELNINFDGQKTKRNIRKAIRETGYYIKENLFIIISAIVIGVIIIAISIYRNTHSNFDRNYSENMPFIYNNVEYNFMDSILTNVDYNGNVINENKYYLVIKTEAKNLGKGSVKLDYASFKLNLGESLLLPIPNLSKKFIDFSSSDSITNITSLQSKRMTLVYELDESMLKGSYKIKIYNGTFADKGDYIDSVINVRIAPDRKTNFVKYNKRMKEPFTLDETLLNKTEITINDALLTKNYIYEYNKCFKEDCKNYKDKLVPSSQNGDNLLYIFKVDGIIDSESEFGRGHKNILEIGTYFMSIKYVYEDKLYEEFHRVTPENAEDFIAIEVNPIIKEASAKYLVIRINNVEYAIEIPIDNN